MSLIIPNLRTNNESQPIYSVSAGDRQISTMLNLATWLKAETSYFSSDKFSWYDALTGDAYPVTGTLNNAGAINSVPAAQFTETQKVDLGSPLGISGDWSKIIVMSPVAIANIQGVMGGKASAPLAHGMYMTTNSGSLRISMVQNGTTAGGTVNQASATPLVAMQAYKQSTGNARLYVNGVLSSPYGTGIAASTDPTLVLGGMPGNNAGAKLNANVAEVLVFNRDISEMLTGQAASDMAVITALLMAKYAI